MKTNDDSLRDLWNDIKHTNIPIIGVPEEEEKEKETEKIFEEIFVKIFPKGNSHPSPGKTEIPIQDIPKEKQAETHINQTNKN